MTNVLGLLILAFATPAVLLFLRRQLSERPPSVQIWDFPLESVARSFHNDRDDCTTTVGCLDWRKCKDGTDLLLHLFPGREDTPPISPLFARVLKLLNGSNLVTTNESESCLALLPLDTIDRDFRSGNYIAEIGAAFAHPAIAQDWNNGSNRLLFNFYHGSYPNYSDFDIGFDPQRAILARASPSRLTYREGFDLVVPLVQESHPSEADWQSMSYLLTRHRDHLASFKGKRYVYGIGSETRDVLYRLADGQQIIVATTCQHNTDWETHQDAKCPFDNEHYGRWDYDKLLRTSHFCFTPRGRRRGSFRFIESLGAGCIPVVLSDDWLLPFHDEIDWASAALTMHEAHVFLVGDVARSMPRSVREKMSRYAIELHRRHFASTEQVVLNAVQMTLNRIAVRRGLVPRRPWSLAGVHVIRKNATLVLFASSSSADSDITVLVSKLLAVVQFQQMLLVWPQQRGVAPTILLPSNVSIQVAVSEEEGQVPWLELMRILSDDYESGGRLVVWISERRARAVRTVRLLKTAIAASRRSSLRIFSATFQLDMGNTTSDRQHIIDTSFVMLHSRYLQAIHEDWSFRHRHSPLIRPCDAAEAIAHAERLSGLPIYQLGNAQRPPTSWMRRCNKTTPHGSSMYLSHQPLTLVNYRT